MTKDKINEYIAFLVDDNGQLNGEIEKITINTEKEDENEYFQEMSQNYWSSGDTMPVILGKELIMKAVEELNKTVKQREFYNVSGIMMCLDCVKNTPEFADLPNMTAGELMATDNQWIEDIEDYMFEKDIEELTCEGSCESTWRIADGEP